MEKAVRKRKKPKLYPLSNRINLIKIFLSQIQRKKSKTK